MEKVATNNDEQTDSYDRSNSKFRHTASTASSFSLASWAAPHHSSPALGDSQALSDSTCLAFWAKDFLLRFGSDKLPHTIVADHCALLGEADAEEHSDFFTDLGFDRFA